MKRFNIVKTGHPVRIHGTFLDFGSVYGTFALSKNRSMDYYIDDLRYVTTAGKPAYYFHFWDCRRCRWIHTNTGANRAYNRFLLFVDRLIRENSLYGTKTVPFVDHVNGRREVPREYLYRSAPGYVLSNRIMTDDTVSNTGRAFALKTGVKAPDPYNTEKLQELYGLNPRSWEQESSNVRYDCKPYKLMKDGSVYHEYASGEEARAYIQLLVDDAPNADAAERVCRRFSVVHYK